MLPRFLITSWTACWVWLWLSTSAAAQIEPLTPPKPKKPPRADQDATIADDLERKREERRRREDMDRPPPVPYEEKQRKALLKDTLKPHERWLLLEVSLIFCGAQTSGDRQGYTCEPTSHFNAFVRKGGKAKDGKVGLWYGARVAPFIGDGFYKERPGSYGLTYFGPMLGVGKIDPVPEDEGVARATSADGEIRIPSAAGWVVTTGIAAVTRLGTPSEPGEADKGDKDNDFVPKGVHFDAPGIWLEARYLHVLFGALGVDAIFGVQSGKQKYFFYGGVGFAAYD